MRERSGPRLAMAVAVMTLAATDLPAEPLPASGADEVPYVTLGEAVRRALERNDRAADLDDGIESADRNVRVARSAFRPQVVPNLLSSFGNSDLSNQTYRLDVTQLLPTGAQLRADVGAVSSQNQLGSFYASDTTLQLTQPLLRGFGGGSARRQLEQSRSQARQARRRMALGESQIAVEVASAYYRLIAQIRLAEVTAQGVERARLLVEASEAKQRIGKVSQVDVLRARRAAAQAEDERLSARAAVEDATDQLQILMGEEPGKPIRVETSVPSTPSPPPADDAVALALERRGELRLAEEEAQQAERSVRFARNQLLPQVDLSLAVTRRETGDTLLQSLGTDGFRVASFVTISSPLSRTAEEVRHHDALVERDRRAREMSATRRRIAQEARRAVRNQERLLQRLAMAEETAGFARTELEVAEIRYQRGYSDNLDVVNAQAGVLAAESTLVATRAELAAADVALRATLGTLDPRRDFGGTAW